MSMLNVVTAMLPLTNPPATDVRPDDHLLSHLKLCPKCEVQRLGVPVICKGREKPEHEGFWYETVCLNNLYHLAPVLHSLYRLQCLDNAAPAHTACNYFAWRSDIPQGKATRGLPIGCPGQACKNLSLQSKRPGVVNAECTFGLCSRCCGLIQQDLPGIRRCHVSKHNKNASGSSGHCE